MLESVSGTCLHTELVGFVSSRPMRSMGGFGLVVQQRTKVEARNEGLANDWFLSPYVAV